MQWLFKYAALRLLALVVPLGLTMLPSIGSANEKFSRDVQCQAEAIQFYFAVIDLQEGVSKKDSIGPTFTSLAIIRGPQVAAELEARYEEIKDSVWELPHFKTMDKTQTGILIYDECLQLGAGAPAKQTPAVSAVGFFNGQLLGTNQRYLESVLGIPRSSFGNNHEFKVQGCDITATIHGGTVTALHMRLTDQCQLDLTAFIGEYAPALGQPLTAGAFTEAAAVQVLEYSADCLSMCGNAYVPSVYAHWIGPHAANFLEVVMEVALKDDPAIAAAAAWRDHMLHAANEDFVMDTRFNCDRRFDPVANQAFKNIKVTGVTIGHNLTTPSC